MHSKRPSNANYAYFILYDTRMYVFVCSNMKEYFGTKYMRVRILKVRIFTAKCGNRSPLQAMKYSSSIAFGY